MQVLFCLDVLRMFAPIVSGHPYYAQLHAQIHVPRHLAAARRAKLWSLNANLFFEEPHQLTKFALYM